MSTLINLYNLSSERLVWHIFCIKSREKMNILTKKLKKEKKRKFYDKDNLKIYFSLKTETKAGHWLKISLFLKVTEKG